MEMKYVVPDMAQSFGTLEFAGESEPVFERDKNNRRVLARRSYNLYSDIQKGENVVVEIPVQAGEKHFKYEQKVKLVNPKLYGRGYAIGDMGHTDYVLVADDIVAVEEKYGSEEFMRLSNGFVIEKERTVVELKFTAVRDVFLQNEDGTPSTQLKKRIYDLKCSLHGGIIPVSVPPEVPLREFPYNAVVELVNPVADTVSRKTYTGADVDWYVKAEDIVLKNKGNQNAGSPQNPTPQGQPKK